MKQNRKVNLSILEVLHDSDLNYAKLNTDIATYMGEELSSGMICVGAMGDRKIWVSPGYHVDWNMLLPVAKKLVVDLDMVGEKIISNNIEQFMMLANKKSLYESCIMALEFINLAGRPHQSCTP